MRGSIWLSPLENHRYRVTQKPRAKRCFYGASMVFIEASSVVLAKVELLHAIDQHLAADIKAFGRLGLIPIETLQRPQNEFTLDRLNTDPLRRQLQLDPKSVV